MAAGNLYAYRLEASHYRFKLTGFKLMMQLTSQKQVKLTFSAKLLPCLWPNTCYLSLHDIDRTATSLAFSPGHTAGTAPHYQETQGRCGSKQTGSGWLSIDWGSSKI